MTKFKAEKTNLTKGKMTHQVGYKKLSTLLDENGKNQLIELMKDGAVCEVLQQQVLSNDAQTLTVKFYFEQK